MVLKDEGKEKGGDARRAIQTVNSSFAETPTSSIHVPQHSLRLDPLQIVM